MIDENAVIEAKRQELTNAIVGKLTAVHARQKKRQLALQIVTELFLRFSNEAHDEIPFDLKQFFASHAISAKQQQRIVNAILQEIYFGVPPFIAVNGCHKYAIEAFVMNILAEDASEKQLKKMLSKMPYKQLVPLIVALAAHLREGSFRLLNFIMQQQIHPTLDFLVHGLTNRIFHPQSLLADIERAEFYHDDLVYLREYLQALRTQYAIDIKTSFENLLANVIASPDIIDKFLNRNIDPSAPTRKIDRLQVDMNIKKAKKLYAPYYKEDFKLADFELMIDYFGFWGHQPPIGVDSQHTLEESFAQKCQWLAAFHGDAKRMLSSNTDEIRFYLWFILKFISHLNAVARNPFIYIKGFDKFVFALPTAHKKLKHFAWLPSVVAAISQILQFSKRIGYPLSFDQIPILVFDQSEGDLFAKNNQFIRRLNRKFGSNVLHFSKQDVHSLSVKLEMDSWIFTAHGNVMGYAGARNCVLLLSPLIAKAVKEGCRSVKDVLEIPKAQFMQWKAPALLGVPINDDYMIHMGDDDLFVPVANVMADLLVAVEKDSAYILNHSYYIGRRSHKIWEVGTLGYALHHPKELYKASDWTDEPYESGMKGTLTKPKFCLNIPLPNEELHVRIQSAYVDPFRQPLVHFGGSRYPQVDLAAHPIIGMHSYLEKHIPYSFGTEVVKTLLDPANIVDRLVLPWNSRRGEPAQIFENFHQVLSVACAEEKSCDMQVKFWRNVHDLVDLKVHADKVPLRKFLNALTHSEHWHEDIHAFLQANGNDPLLKVECAKVLQVYEKFQREALIAIDFINAVKENMILQLGIADSPIKALWYDLATNRRLDVLAVIERSKAQVEMNTSKAIHELPLVYQFYLVMRSVGAAQISMLAKKLLS